MVDNFNRGQLPGAKFVYIDSYKSTFDLFQNASAAGNMLYVQMQVLC